MPVECNWVGDYEDPAKLNRESRRGERICVASPREPVNRVPVSPCYEEIDVWRSMLLQPPFSSNSL